MQPDTIVPDLSNPQGWNRFSYVTNRPVNFNDPTGHSMDDGCKDYGCDFGASSSTFSSSSYTPESTGGDPDDKLSGNGGGGDPNNPAVKTDEKLIRQQVEFSSLLIGTMDPFAGPLESPEDYWGLSKVLEFFRWAYTENGIDLNRIGINGLENELNFTNTHDDPFVYIYLSDRKDYLPYRHFVEKMGLDTENVYNYEPYYLNVLMMHHPNELRAATYSTYQDINNGVWSEEFFRYVTKQIEDDYR